MIAKGRTQKAIEEKVKSFYARYRWVGIFARLRFWTGSFSQIEQYIPRSGTILDLGCGYGIFVNYLALSSKKRKVIGVDLDKGKLRYAQSGVPNVTFRHGDATKKSSKNLKAVILLDVLHHLHSYAEQERLIHKTTTLLKAGGKLIISEIDSSPFWKLVLAFIADFLLYRGQPVYYGYQKRLLPVLREEFGARQVKVITLAHNPFPHLLYICEKP